MTKRSALQILRDRERDRRLVPPVVIRRRRLALAVQPDDPGLSVLNKSNRMSRRHAKKLQDLLLRSMALTQAPKILADTFDEYGLPELKMDSSAEVLINNAIRRVSEILLFRMVADDIVNDKELRDKMVDLFVHQRFDMMKYKPPRDNKVKDSTPTDNSEDIVNAVNAAMAKLMDI